MHTSRLRAQVGGSNRRPGHKPPTRAHTSDPRAGQPTPRNGPQPGEVAPACTGRGCVHRSRLRAQVAAARTRRACVHRSRLRAAVDGSNRRPRHKPPTRAQTSDPRAGQPTPRNGPQPGRGRACVHRSRLRAQVAAACTGRGCAHTSRLRAQVAPACSSRRFKPPTPAQTADPGTNKRPTVGPANPDDRPAARRGRACVHTSRLRAQVDDSNRRPRHKPPTRAQTSDPRSGQPTPTTGPQPGEVAPTCTRRACVHRSTIQTDDPGTHRRPRHPPPTPAPPDERGAGQLTPSRDFTGSIAK